MSTWLSYIHCLLSVNWYQQYANCIRALKGTNFPREKKATTCLSTSNFLIFAQSGSLSTFWTLVQTGPMFIFFDAVAKLNPVSTFWTVEQTWSTFAFFDSRANRSYVYLLYSRTNMTYVCLFYLHANRSYVYLLNSRNNLTYICLLNSCAIKSMFAFMLLMKLTE